MNYPTILELEDKFVTNAGVSSMIDSALESYCTFTTLDSVLEDYSTNANVNEKIQALSDSVAEIYLTKDATENLSVTFAETADKFKTARKIYAAGDVSGNVTFDGSKDVVFNMSVTNAGFATRAGTANTADNCSTATSAITANSAGQCTGNSATASKLQTARKIMLKGDATAEGTFDGSSDLKLSVEVMNSTKAISDGEGNNIVDTYATKSELAENYTTTAALSSIYATKAELPMLNFSIEAQGTSSCLIVTDGNGKIYKFFGAEVLDDG